MVISHLFGLTKKIFSPEFYFQCWLSRSILLIFLFLFLCCLILFRFLITLFHWHFYVIKIFYFIINTKEYKYSRVLVRVSVIAHELHRRWNDQDKIQWMRACKSRRTILIQYHFTDCICANTTNVLVPKWNTSSLDLGSHFTNWFYGLHQ